MINLRRSWSRVSGIVLIVLLIWARPVVSMEYVKPVFGAWTQIWPWMWRNGDALSEAKDLSASELYRWKFAEANLSRYPKAGFTWNVVVLRQGLDGKDGFLRAKAIVAEQKRLGVQSVFRLIEQPQIYTASEKDLKRNGVLQEYADWVESVVRTFAKDVTYYIISNEVDHDFGHNLLRYQRIHADYSRYRSIYQLAYDTIKKYDADLKVVDHGVSSYSLGLAVADYIRREEGWSAAYDFWHTYHFNRKDKAGGLLRFARILTRPDSRRRIEIANNTFSQRNVDLYQLHWYFSSQALTQVLKWIELKTGKTSPLPVMVAELGYRMPYMAGHTWDGRATNVADYSRYSQDEHAAELMKNIVLLLSRGVRYIQYWQVRLHHQRDASAQLFFPATEIEDFQQSLAFSAYQRLITLFSGSYSSTSCNDDVQFVRCAFRLADKNVEVMWSNDVPAVVPLAANVSAVYEHGGRAVNVEQQEMVTVGRFPLIIVTPLPGPQNVENERV